MDQKLAEFDHKFRLLPNRRVLGVTGVTLENRAAVGDGKKLGSRLGRSRSDHVFMFPVEMTLLLAQMTSLAEYVASSWWHGKVFWIPDQVKRALQLLRCQEGEAKPTRIGINNFEVGRVSIAGSKWLVNVSILMSKPNSNDPHFYRGLVPILVPLYPWFLTIHSWTPKERRVRGSGRFWRPLNFQQAVILVKTRKWDRQYGNHIMDYYGHNSSTVCGSNATW